MTDSSGGNGNDRWRGFEAVSGAIAKVLIPALIALVGWWFTAAIKQREIGATFVQLSIDILEEAPDKRPPGLTEWSMDIIDKYSGVDLSPAARDALAQGRLRVPLQLAPNERHVTSVTADDEGSFSLEGIGSAVIRVAGVGVDGVSGLRIEASSGMVVTRERLQVGDLVHLTWPNGRGAVVKLKAVDPRTGEAIFSISVAE